METLNHFINTLIDSANAINAKAKTFSSPVLDVTMTGKVSKLVNTLNRTQEFFFRNLAFEAKLRQIARQAGVNFKNIGPDDIPKEMYEKAADYALDMTFAGMPKSKFGQDFVRWASHPVFTSLFNPFPRFMFGNAIPFLKRFSPIGFLEAAKPSVVAEMVTGNPDRFVKAASEATLGTIMFNTAAYIRNSDMAGERWYEVKAGDKYIDTRAFAPFSTYLFLAESVTNPERIKPADWGQAALSLNRVGGTGLVLADILRGKDAAVTKDNLMIPVSVS